MSAATANLASGGVRAARRDLKQDISEGRMSLRVVLMDPPDFAARMEIRQLLLACPRIGRQRMNRICQRTRILPTRWVGELSREDRWRLTFALDGEAQ